MLVAYAAMSSMPAYAQVLLAPSVAPPGISNGEALAVADGTTIAPAANRGMAGRSIDCGSAAGADTLGQGIPSCAIDDVARGFTLTTRQDTDFGQFEAFGTFATSASGNFTPERQLQTSAAGFNRHTEVYQIGFKGELLDRRLKVMVQTAHSELSQTSRNMALLSAPRRKRDGGNASTVRLEWRPIDRAGLRWTITGQIDLVSDAYSPGDVAAPPQLMAMPGNRFALTNQVKVGGTDFRASLESFTISFGTSRAMRFGFDRGGLSLRLASRNSQVEPSAQTAYAASQAHKVSAYLDIQTAVLLPAMIPGSGLLGQFVPGNLSLGIDAGRTTNRFAGITQSFRQGGWEITGSWDTKLGSTTISYRRDYRRGLPGSAGARDNSYLDVTHTVRSGKWRFGVDATFLDNAAVGRQTYRDHSVSFGPTVSYSKRDGAEFSLRVGRDSGQSSIADGSYWSSQHSTAVVARLDLTRYLRQRFDRSDLYLKIDYRKRLDSTADVYSLFEQELYRQTSSFAREGLLLTYGMRI